MMTRLLSNRNPFVRKGTAALLQAPRALRRLTAAPETFSARPPAVANSFPKSGTHLLLQILGALPGVKSYGTFWASMPSVTFRERPAAKMGARIRRVVPGELVGAHLFYDPSLPPLLANRGAAHFFIVRDPRDVVVSEAYYLGDMNRWHRLHRHFDDLSTLEQQIAFSISGGPNGFPYDYPDVGERFRRYAPWLDQPDVMVVRFEDLVGAEQETWLEAIVDFYYRHRDEPLSARERQDLVRGIQSRVDPGGSRTFRKGVVGAWREHFTPRHLARIKEVAGDLLLRLGYESGLDW